MAPAPTASRLRHRRTPTKGTEGLGAMAGPLIAWFAADHARLDGLLRRSVAELRSVLEPHNAVEEEPGGLYETCDRLLAPEAASLLERIGAYPAVKTAPHNDGPGVFRTAEEALRGSARQAERPPPPATKEG